MKPSLIPNLWHREGGTCRYLLALELCRTVLIVFGAFLIARIVDGVFLSGRGLNETAPDLLVLFVVLGIGAFLRHLRRGVLRQLSAGVRLTCRDALHRQLLTERRQPAGSLLTLALETTDALDKWFTSVLPECISLVVIVPVLLVTAAAFDPLTAGLFLVTLPIAPFLLYLAGRVTKDATSRQWQTLRRLNDGFEELIAGMVTLKIFRQEGRQERHLASLTHAFSASALQVLRLAFVSSFILELITTLSIAIIAVGIGFRLIAGRIDFLTAFFILLLAPEFYQPLRSGGIAFHAAMTALTAEETLKKEGLLANGKKTTDNRAVPSDSVASADENEPSTTNKSASVTFDHVSFAYLGTTAEILHDISVTFPAGTATVIGGPTGTGKSTLLRLAAGLLKPDNGTIRLVSNSESINPATASPAELSQYVSFVPQEPHLFNATLRENVTLFRTEYSDTAIREALRCAGLGAFYRTLPQGLNAKLGEGGQALSAGQRHRLGLSRAFLQNRPLILLDEPTANLDAESEVFVIRSLQELTSTGRHTLLIVSHRPAVRAAFPRHFDLEPYAESPKGGADT